MTIPCMVSPSGMVWRPTKYMYYYLCTCTKECCNDQPGMAPSASGMVWRPVIMGNVVYIHNNNYTFALYIHNIHVYTWIENRNGTLTVS